MAEKNTLDEQLGQLEDLDSDNWQRLSFVLRKHLDIWAHHYFKSIWSEVKLSYMPIMFSIRIEGSTASDIARDAMLPKQSVSRSIKELEAENLVIRKTSSYDKRIELLTLTERGKEFILNAKKETHKMNAVYAKLVGTKDLAIAAKVINTIIDYHESMGQEVI